MTTSFRKGLSRASIREKVKRFYDLGFPLYMEVYGEHLHDGYYITGKESKEEAQENLIKLLVAEAKIKRGSSVLDIGCGVGGSSIWLAENLEAVTTGITISPMQVEIARKLALRLKSSFLLMDAEDMHFNESFDIMWVVAAITHFQNQENFIKSATGFLNKKGKFIIFDWMLPEDAVDVQNDRYLKSVSEGFLLTSLYPLGTYLKWLIQYGCRIIYSKDITERTIKTWDVALSVIKEPSVLDFAYRLTKDDLKGALRFLKSLRAMRLAMKKGKLISGAVVAEKL